MGIIETELARWSNILLGGFIQWMLPLVGALGLLYAGYRLKPKPKRGKLRQDLANFLCEGEDIKGQCYDQQQNAPEEQALAWADKIAIYLTTNLGDDYRISFYNSDGLPPSITHLSGDYARIEAFMRYRIARIQQFLAELRG